MNKRYKKDRLFFYVLIRSWNAFDYFDRCANSVFKQSYKNFQILYVDDCSDYNTQQKSHIKSTLAKHKVVFNKARKYSVFNAYNMIHKFATDNDAVVVNLDGDDWLKNKNALKFISDVYRKKPKTLLTYGECVLWNGEKLSKPSRHIRSNTNVRYSTQIIRDNSHRKEPFYPLHPRSWKVWLFKKIAKKDFLRPDGTWLKEAEDQAIFYPMLEMAKGRFEAIKKPLYVYNVANKLAVQKTNYFDGLKDELIVRRKKAYEPIA